MSLGAGVGQGIERDIVLHAPRPGQVSGNGMLVEEDAIVRESECDPLVFSNEKVYRHNE